MPLTYINKMVEGPCKLSNGVVSFCIHTQSSIQLLRLYSRYYLESQLFLSRYRFVGL